MPKRNTRPEQPEPAGSPAPVDRQAALAVALDCAGRGWPVFPVNAASKTPAVKGWQAVATRDPEVIRGWFESGRFADCVPGIPTGKPSGLVVVDFDVPSSDHPDARGWDTMKAKAAQWEHEGGWGPVAVARTASGGLHYLYRYPAEGTGPDADPSYRIGNRANLYGKNSGVDVRGDGGFVVAPGLPGREWEVPPEHPGEAGNAPWGEPPAWLLADLRRAESPADGERPAGRGTLADLLASPPRGQGNRNDWLARVCGQLAARERHRDSYLAQVRLAAGSIEPPLPGEEVDKTADSIWKTEQTKRREAEATPSVALDEPTTEEAAQATADGRAGHLAPARGTQGERLGMLLYRARLGSGDASRVEWREWADFDLEATGVLQDDGFRTYELRLYTARDVAAGKPPAQLQLDSRTLADRRKLNAWLAGVGATIGESWRAEDRLDATVRLQRYLDAQNPPAFTVVPYLGWHDDIQVPGAAGRGGFVTVDGVITVDGKYTGPGVRPAPHLAKLIDFRYGTGRGEDEVRRVLREILTFHHEEVASVFGAWWAATLVKHAVRKATPAFPFMGIEAPSESGKTTGMFGMLIQLSGNHTGQSTSTVPAFRDALSANRNGIVWLDDADTIADMEELIRQATSEGVVGKKAEDRMATINTRLVAPFVISGESLGLTKEKALIDRSIRLKVPSPTKRKSLRPGAPADRLQWADMTELRATYDDDFTQLSGTLVQMALRHADRVTAAVHQLRAKSGGRMGDAMAVLQAGARLLSALTGDSHHVDIVGRWVDQQHDYGDENALTLEVLPRLLAAFPAGGECIRRQVQRGAELVVPYVVRDGHLWVSSELAAEWYQLLPSGRRRLADGDSLRDQLVALAPDKRRVNVVGDANTKVTYRRLPVELSQRLLSIGHEDRSSGGVQAGDQLEF